MRMAELIHLAPGEQMPALPDEEPWILVEASNDGRFFGTGAANKPNGDEVIYASLPENDVSLDVALAAAQKWAARHDVRRIWVQATPDR